MRSVLAWSVVSLCFAGCPKLVPDAKSGQNADAGLTAEQALQREVERIDTEAAATIRAADEALWQHWTQGTTLELLKATAGHENLLSLKTLETLRRAQTANVEPVRARHLEWWLTGELLARSLAGENEAIASLEATATFALDGKEVGARDVSRLLVTEKSAVKRRALWAASSAVSARLDVLLAHRDAVAAETLATLKVPSLLEFEAQTREVNLEVLAAQARNLLEATDPLWKETLKTLSDAEMKLPLDALTRADLPRLLKVPQTVDAAFPRQAVATMAIDTLASMGLYGQKGLTFDLAEAARKKPLPLTVAPSRDDVRLSYKPAGGLRDLVQLMGEVGTALALRSAHTGHVSTDRLGDPARALTLSMLFMGLVGDSAWLEQRGVPVTLHSAIRAAMRAHRLYVLRKACLIVVLRLETTGLSDAESRAKAAELTARALGVKVAADEGIRVRLELDDSLRAATTIKAMGLAAVERKRLTPLWWHSSALLERWASGTSQPPPSQAEQDEAFAALLESFDVVAPGHAPASQWPTPVEPKAPSDGGIDTR